MHLTPKSVNSHFRINFTETTSLFSYMSISKIMPKQGIAFFHSLNCVAHEHQSKEMGNPYINLDISQCTAKMLSSSNTGLLSLTTTY